MGQCVLQRRRTKLQTNEFEQQLKRAGYREIASKTLEPRPPNSEHAHEFSVRGLVISGEFIITCDGVSQSYEAGKVFDVAAGQMHTEAVGPHGTCITTGRMY